jgi:hypothetical protein
MQKGDTAMNMNEIVERELSMKELKENRYPCSNNVTEAYEWSHADVDRKVLCIIENDDISENPMEGWFGWTLAETSGRELCGEMEHLFRVVEDTDAYKARETEIDSRFFDADSDTYVGPSDDPVFEHVKLLCDEVGIPCYFVSEGYDYYRLEKEYAGYRDTKFFLYCEDRNNSAPEDSARILVAEYSAWAFGQLLQWSAYSVDMHGNCEIIDSASGYSDLADAISDGKTAAYSAFLNMFKERREELDKMREDIRVELTVAMHSIELRTVEPWQGETELVRRENNMIAAARFYAETEGGYPQVTARVILVGVPECGRKFSRTEAAKIAGELAKTATAEGTKAAYNCLMNEA